MFKPKFTSSNTSFSPNMVEESKTLEPTFNALKVIEGEDGFSPIVEINPDENGYTLTITDKEGSQDIYIANGADGRDGADGKDGKDGAPGPQGPQGPVGKTGAQGPQGPIGPAGPQGKTGAKGDPGASGKDGYTPIKGVDYFDGKPGEKGADGYSPVISTTTLSNGHRVTIVDGEGEKSFDVFNGEKGEKGEQGPQGIAGPQGPTGPQGPIGITGATGAIGPVGPQGPQGEQGPKGENGEDGKDYIITDEDIGELSQKVQRVLYRHDIELYDWDSATYVYLSIVNGDGTDYTSELEYDANDGYIGSHPEGVYNFLPNDTRISATGYTMSGDSHVPVFAVYRYEDDVTVYGFDGGECSDVVLTTQWGNIHDTVTAIPLSDLPNLDLEVCVSGK